MRRIVNILGAKPFPELSTDRLLLRCPNSKDTIDYHRILQCPETARYTDVPYNPTAKRSKQFVAWMSKLHRRGIGVGWIIQLQHTNTTIGSIRINRIEKKANCGVIAYELHPEFWNAGYASEALAAVVIHAHHTLSLNRLEAWTTEGNVASEKVLRKNGFLHEGTQRAKARFRDQYWNIHVHARLAEDDLLASSVV